MLFEGPRLNDRYWRWDVLLEVGLCGSRLLLDDHRRLRDRLLAARFVRSRPALLRPLLRPLLRLAIAIPVALTMTIAAAAPLLFSLLGRLLARIGEAAFRARLPRLRWLLWLLWLRRPLLLLSFATGAGTIALGAARLLTRPAIAATVAPAMTLAIAIGAAAATLVALARALLSCRGLRTSGLPGNGGGRRAGFLHRRDWLGRFRREPTQNTAKEPG